MSLRATLRPGDNGYPHLVFLHGFSGDRREWQEVGERLTSFPRLYVDLPGHGASAEIAGVDFTCVCNQLQETLDSYNILSYWLVGYSLGGRVAMHFASATARHGLQGLIVEGGHPGLQNDDARSARRDADLSWARRFAQASLPEVFDAWYQQPVFASLTTEQRQALVALRAKNIGVGLAEMLMATSLAVQPDLRESLAHRDYPFWYLCGERDSKFRSLSQELNASCSVIPQAGHNAHRENPDAVAACLAQILKPDNRKPYDLS